MALVIDDFPTAVRAAKATIRASLPELKSVMRDIEEAMKREVDTVVEEREGGRGAVPILQYADIRSDKVDPALVERVRRRGALVVRGTFPVERATAWDSELGAYVKDNGYYEAKKDPNLDKYFSTLKSDRPQIFGIYWSKPQIEARQSEELATTRRFLNRLWETESNGKQVFDPDREATYADRIRRREPGDRTLGLSPHMDGGSVERWLDPNFRNVYRHVFSGNWRAFDPFDATSRTEVEEVPSPAVCSAFRTYQGWTALTRQGPKDGTLQLVPIANSIAYMLLRALQDDVPEDELCGALPARALVADPKWHPVLMPALSSIPLVEPGDTVWWHPDIVHAVEDHHQGKGYSDVMYIGAAPWCTKNAAYLARQKERFLKGESAPDFAAENYEVDYVGRATLDDLTPLGRRQMGFDSW